MRAEKTVERLSKGAKASVKNEEALDVARLDAVKSLTSPVRSKSVQIVLVEC